MFIRIVEGIRLHWKERIVEWAMAAAMVNWGRILMMPGDGLFTTSDRSFIMNIGRWISSSDPEFALGAICVLVGLARLLALVINGTFYDAPYSKFSPHVRGATAIVSSAIWLLLLLSQTGTYSTGTGLLPLPLVLDIYCVVHATGDSGRAANLAKCRNVRRA